MSAPQIILDLVERFECNSEVYTSGHYNETQLRREFLDPFFTALGWDVANVNGNAEMYKDVIHEDAIKIGGATKAPDYCFQIGGWSQVLSARRKSEKEEFDERILGDGDFVNAILRETEEKMRHQLKSRKMGRTLNKIIAEECQKGKISVKELQNGGRRKQVSEIRAKVSIRGQEEFGLTMAEIARQTGVNTSSIARAIERKREKAS